MTFPSNPLEPYTVRKKQLSNTEKAIEYNYVFEKKRKSQKTQI